MMKRFFVLFGLFFALTAQAFDPVLEKFIPLVDKQYFVLQYNPVIQATVWSIYRLNAGNLQTAADRTNMSFRTDKKVSNPVRPSAYERSGNDMGHLVPARDMSFSLEALKRSMLTCNVLPQPPPYNRGIWKKLEAKLRAEASAGGDYVIITGPVNPRVPPLAPDGFFKIVYDLNNNTATAYMIPVNFTSDNLKDYITEIAIIRNLTGIDFKAPEENKYERQMRNN